MIASYIKEMIPCIIAALIILAAVRFIGHKKAGASLKDVNWAREAGVFLLTAILAGLMAKTVLQGILIIDGRLRFLYRFGGTINFIPFKNLSIISSGGLFDILGNTIMFIPIGLLLPLLFKPFRKWWAAAGFCFLLSLFIETAQLFLPRSTDINDLMLNTLGGAAGYMIYLLIVKSKKRKMDNKQ